MLLFNRRKEHSIILHGGVFFFLFSIANKKLQRKQLRTTFFLSLLQYNVGQFQFILEGRLPEDWECTHTVVRSEHLSQAPETRRIHAIMFLVVSRTCTRTNNSFNHRCTPFFSAGKCIRQRRVLLTNESFCIGSARAP